MQKKQAKMTKADKRNRLNEIRRHQQEVYNEYFRPRPDDALDLSLVMSYLIRDEIGQKYADIFLQDIDIATIRDKNPGVQRVIINKYFGILLFRFKAITGISILQARYWRTLEGTQEDWFKLMSGYLIPYCKHYKLFETIYG